MCIMALGTWENEGASIIHTDIDVLIVICVPNTDTAMIRIEQVQYLFMARENDCILLTHYG